MDLDKLKLVAVFAKWLDGDQLTVQEFNTITTVISTPPPIAGNQQEVLGILNRFAAQIQNLLKQFNK